MTLYSSRTFLHSKLRKIRRLIINNVQAIDNTERKQINKGRQGHNQRWRLRQTNEECISTVTERAKVLTK